MSTRFRAFLFGAAVLGVVLITSRASADDEEVAPLAVEHPECSYFGPERERLARAAAGSDSRSALTDQVAQLLPASGGKSPARRATGRGLIDKEIFETLEREGVTAAPLTNDYEFIRRVTLDLTGRIPTTGRVVTFAEDSSPDKREKLVDELLGSPEWVDKWTMYFGDLYVNMDNNTTNAVRRYPQGRNAFHLWIRNSLASNKPYSQIASEIIGGEGANSYEAEQGQINWTVNGRINNGPIQDTYDQQAANVAATFLGLSQMNCILCHNGRGHLDSLSLWGKTATRVEAWGMAAYFAKTNMRRVPVSSTSRQPYYWAVEDTGRRDYPLNTTTGNRPARCVNNLPPITTNGRTACAQTGTFTPVYPFSGNAPGPGENYRVALAREVTADFQFARATVNYIWKEFFGRGIVDPVDQFDLARLDPDNPPPAPWTLQPSHPRLLRGLAQDFIAGGHNLKSLMRQIVTSEAYQLSSRYEGAWNPVNEKLFARKMVRRLWAEEIHDAVAQSSNVIPSYTINGGLGRVSWAMQFPEHRNIPNRQIATFLDSFLRGNRDDQERRPEGSLSQALSLMNDNFVMSRIRATGSGDNESLLRKNLRLTDDALVENLYLAVLSRHPTDREKETALNSLKAGNRTQKAEHLLWSLYNKVDFIFNY